MQKLLYHSVALRALARLDDKREIALAISRSVFFLSFKKEIGCERKRAMKFNLIFVLLDVLLAIAYPVLYVIQRLRRFFGFKR